MRRGTLTPVDRLTIVTLERAAAMLAIVIENASTVELALIKESSKLRAELAHWRGMCEQFNAENDSLRAAAMRRRTISDEALYPLAREAFDGDLTALGYYQHALIRYARLIEKASRA